MSAREFQEWVALSRIEPIGLGDRLDYLFAHLMWMQAMVNRDRRSRKPKWHEFLPPWSIFRQSSRRPNKQQLIEKMNRAFMALGGVINEE